MGKIFVLILGIFLLAAGCNEGGPSANNQNVSCVPITVKSDEGYARLYDQVTSREKTFTGTLNANPVETEASILQHYLPYKVNGVSVYTYSDLSSYVGKPITVQGKLNNFQLEGQNLTEIWPKTMCVQASG